jgi:hypothetical protein
MTDQTPIETARAEAERRWPKSDKNRRILTSDAVSVEKISEYRRDGFVDGADWQRASLAERRDDIARALADVRAALDAT